MTKLGLEFAMFGRDLANMPNLGFQVWAKSDKFGIRDTNMPNLGLHTYLSWGMFARVRVSQKKTREKN